MVQLEVGWTWAVPVCMLQLWPITPPNRTIHRYHIHCQTQLICWAVVSTCCRTPTKCCPVSQLAVSVCHTPATQHRQHRKPHHRDPNEDTLDAPHAIARIVKRPNVLDRPEFICARRIHTIAISLAVVRSTARRAI